MALKFGRVFSSPIFVGTLLLMFGGIIAALICAGLKNGYVEPTTWFMIIYLALLAITLVVAIADNALHRYRLALLTMIGVGLSLNVSHIGYYINATIGVLQAMSASLIFVEIPLFFWVIILGSGPGTYLAEVCGMEGKGSGSLPMADVSMSRVQYRHTVNSATGGARSSIADYYTSDLHQSVISGKRPDSSAVVYKARALYPYEANPDDPNEVSIAKEEIMLVIDDSGKWWQVKKEDGTVGIAPSNYLARITS
ncbi:Transmembrane osmosensor [Coemansia sp. RSA 1722]|nr:Transmembrane osmosensor [Coemansia sp. RSA 1722]KAJ2596743.1 Transmembrane osmosensor [Coemansia sp. RSA 1721]KAJ2706999.1 Transmembrane osmosensor [Coemansia sp. IMI 203386]